MSLNYNHKLIPRAKELRKGATQQENHLWYDFLRNYPVRFQRQKTIGSFIADFYCHAAKLVIELDGAHHYGKNNVEYDEHRTAVLEKYGLTVIRFSNYDIDRDFSGVCRRIDLFIKEQQT